MTKKLINLHSDYTQFNSNYQLCLPLNYEAQIKKDDPVRLLNELLEGLNYTKLIATYSDLGTNPALPPVVMFKIFIYAYLRGVYSTRKMAELVYDSVACQWLLNGRKAPAHDAFQHFRKHHLGDGVMEDLFFQFVDILYQLDEIQLKNLFVDGTKIHANANCYTFVWKKSIIKYRAKHYEKIEKLLNDFNATYFTTHEFKVNTVYSSLDKCLAMVSEIIKVKKTKFVHGKGKRKSNEQKFSELLTEYKETLVKYDLYLEVIGDKRSSMSKTDIEATFMRMKEDHMKNGQLKPGYNVQIGVESGYVVACDIFQNANDLNTLIPFLESFSDQLAKQYENIIADAGYESEENYDYLKRNGYKTYIKPTNYEQLKTRKFKAKIGRRENMIYNQEADEYICANGKKLILVDTKIRPTKTNYEREVSIYECEDCSDCPLRSKCTKAQEGKNKRIEASKKMIELREESQENITTAEGRQLRMNRSIQVEGAFGSIKNNQGFRRFLMRGIPNVKVEFLLLSFAFNLRKLHYKIQSDKCGLHLHELKEEKAA